MLRSGLVARLEHHLVDQKGCGFDPWSGRMPRVQAWSHLVQEATDRRFPPTSVFLSLPFSPLLSSPPPPSKVNKHILG